MPHFEFAADAFGDRYDLAALPLPRPARGYGVQMLDTDRLLDRQTGVFLPVRAAALDGLFASFDEAHAAACCWVEAHCPTPEAHDLAIVPASYDDLMQRHILIYGVLRGQH